MFDAISWEMFGKTCAVLAIANAIIFTIQQIKLKDQKHSLNQEILRLINRIESKEVKK